MAFPISNLIEPFGLERVIIKMDSSEKETQVVCDLGLVEAVRKVKVDTVVLETYKFN